MAVAEARAAWQRTINRCLVQEDAKRAPKLACCPSASPSSTREVDTGFGPRSAAADVQDTPSVVFLPFNWNTPYSNLSSNSRWWLQLQPSHNRGLIYPEESEMKTSHHGLGSGVKCAEVGSEDNGSKPVVEDSMKDEPFFNSDVRTSYSNVEGDYGFDEKLDFEPIHKGSLFDSSVDIYKDGNKAVLSKKTEDGPFPFSEFTWVGYDDKTEPWWRIADEDELAFLLARRSFGLIENCDLPQPQSASVKMQGFNQEKKTGVSRVEPKLPAACGVSNCNQNNVASEGESQKEWSPLDCYLPSSTSTITSLRDRTMATMSEESDSSKAKLLEALRHSQTRAREAELAAKQAYKEREHVVKLVFKQASQLFAYKQWFQLLQLENLCYQIRNKNEPISNLFPMGSPWMMLRKPRKLRKNWQKGSGSKRGCKGCPKPDICKYAVVFALGLSLVGAGLLLGWTVGWMLPTF